MANGRKNTIVFNLSFFTFRSLVPGRFLLIVLFLLLSFPCSGRAAQLYFESDFQDRSVRQGDDFAVDVMLDTQGQEVNAVEASLLFSQDKVNVADISIGGSALELWTEEPFFSNETGEINFSGGTPKGFEGKNKLMTLTFRTLPSIGDVITAEIIFRSGSRVLLNDGYGREASVSFQPIDIAINLLPDGFPSIGSKTHPSQVEWYSGKKLNVFWEAEKDCVYSYRLSNVDNTLIASGEKTEQEVGSGIDFDLEGKEDGVYYFSLRQKQKGEEWSQEATHFRIMIDSVPPEEFTPLFGRDQAIEDGKTFLSFSAKDEMSGVSHYEVFETENFGFLNPVADFFVKPSWKKADGIYILERQGSGSRVFVRAVDRAGNERVSSASTGFSIFVWAVPAVILALMAVLAMVIIKKRKSKK